MTSADDIVICSPLRTPVGSFLGAFSALSATDLASGLLRELMTRTGLEPMLIDDVILGQCSPNGEAPAIGRVAALDAGLGIGVPGLQIDRRCGSGLMAVIVGAMQVQTGAAKWVVAGGAESMSQTEHYALGVRRGVASGGLALEDRLARARMTAGGSQHPVPGGMIETAENLRREYSISRKAQDLLAVTSQGNWAQAQQRGDFADEIVPVSVPQRKGAPTMVAVDEHPRPTTTLDGLAALKPIMGQHDPEATVTAGNSSGQNDGAALCLVTTREESDRKGLEPLLTLRGWSVAGVAPETMGIGPVPATQSVLAKTGLTLTDLDLIELNEAFAAQVLACLTELELSADDERVNPLGSGISMGHPLGATGARILTTMAHEAKRRQARYCLETMCIGGGQGLAAIFERVV